MGIPSVTTNLSGFGCFMQEHVADPTAYGEAFHHEPNQGEGIPHQTKHRVFTEPNSNTIPMMIVFFFFFAVV